MELVINNLEEVKKILEKVLDDYAGDDNPSAALKYYIPSVAQRISQLFEPKPADNPEMSREEASEIVKNAFGSRPDLPSGKDFVDKVRGHIEPKFNNALEADAHNWDARELE